MEKKYYVSGSAVPSTSPEPVRRERVDRNTIEERRRQSRKNAARRNRERALSMSPARMVFMTACVLLSVYAAVTLVQMQSSVTQRMKNIANLEAQLQNLKADNDAKYKEIVTSVDLEYIKDVAINELGMTYASEEQIIYYSVDDENFMDQYRDIPE